MRQMPNSKERTLFFPQRITEAIEKTFDFPLSIIEAPMGYGKTTAVKEHIILSNGNLYWQNIHNTSKAAFWIDFCRLFEELDNDRAHSLAQLGFPDDNDSLHAALKLIKDIAFPKQTIIVIDNFHLVEAQEIADFITFLTVNEIANLHIMLISRFFDFSNKEELSLKGYLYHIKKESFEFSPKEIVDYYKSCGIRLTANEANKLYTLTEGWISALYLLMLNLKDGGNLLTPVTIYNLVEQAIYDPFPDEIKHFLLSMSIYNRFTQKQASYMMPDANITEIIDNVTGRNAFVMYDSIEKNYYIHNTFKNFLANKLNSMSESFRTELNKKAAGWYIQIGDYLQSMQYSYICGDFDTLLEALELDKGQSINGEHKELLIKYFEDCPLSKKTNHPYAVLIYTRQMFLFSEISLFKKNVELFMTIYRSIDAEDTTYKNRLLGEYNLLLGIVEYNDIEKMAEHFKEAYILLKEPSRILDSLSSWTFGSPSVLYLFYRKSGELFKDVQIMREIMPYYYQITGNHGKGAVEIMIAEYFYYMGDFQNAEIAMHSAYQAAAEASDIMLCTMFLNIKISFMKGRFNDALKLFRKLRESIFHEQWHMLLHMIDLCSAYVYCVLQMSEQVEPWIKNGEFQNTQLLFPSHPYLNIVYGKVLLANAEYLKLLGRAEEFLSMARIYPNLLAQIYTYIYIAAASAQISRMDSATAALEQALSMAMPDHIYMPFVVNGEYIKPLLEELQERNLYADDIARILVLYKQYYKAAEHGKHMMMKNSLVNKTALTEREYEIACLAAQGLSNKEISTRLYISVNTVKTQLKSVFAKLGVNSRNLLKQKLKI